jgi:hypothetical protein
VNADARRSKIALGLAVVQLVFIGETWVADHHVQHPASPVVWTVLGVGMMVALGCAGWFHRRARHAPAPGPAREPG